MTARDPARILLKHWRRLLGAGLLGALFFGNQGFRSLLRGYRELHSLRREIAKMERETTRLEEKSSLVHGAPPALERLARRELGYIKPGEIEYRFPPPVASGASAPLDRVGD